MSFSSLSLLTEYLYVACILISGIVFPIQGLLALDWAHTGQAFVLYIGLSSIAGPSGVGLTILKSLIIR